MEKTHWDTEKIEKLLDLYGQLCRHCDAIFDALSRRFPEEIKCREGCSSCCIIESVTPLEAFAIERYLVGHAIPARHAEPGACALLVDGSCGVYPVRPLICRTHGLLLYDSEAGSLARSCGLNFKDRDLTGFTHKDGVDTVNITENLIRLNMAFQILTGGSPDDASRVKVSDLS